MYGILSLLITLIGVLQILIIVRIVMSYFPGARYHPIGRVIAAIVDPILAPFRAILPTFAGIDFSPMLAILVLLVLSRVLESLQYGEFSASGALTYLIVNLVLGIFGVFCLLILVRVVMSLFHASPYHPLVLFVHRSTDPLVRPFSGVIGRGYRRGFDTGAMVALVFYVVALIIIRILIAQIPPF